MQLTNGVTFLQKNRQVYELTLPHDLATAISLLRKAAEKAQKSGESIPLEITLPPDNECPSVLG